MALSKLSYKSTPRYGHVAVAVGHRQFTWGGFTGDWDKSNKDARIVEIFDLSSEQWEKRSTRGPQPPGFAYAAYTTIGTTLYWFGGCDGHSRYNRLHRLDLSSLEWEEVVPRNPSAAPQRKTNCQMVSFQDNKLVVFAGYTEGDQRTDELHVFNLEEGTWSSPPTTGDKPPPCSSFTLTKIDAHHAVMFGGTTSQHALTDVFILELGKWHWTKLKVSGPKPTARESHAACCLAGPFTGQEHPLLMVVGGKGDRSKTFDDGWILDVDQRRWTELDFPGKMQSRYYHTAIVFGSAPDFRQVVLHGGQPRPFTDPLTATTLLNLRKMQPRYYPTPSTSLWMQKILVSGSAPDFRQVVPLHGGRPSPSVLPGPLTATPSFNLRSQAFPYHQSTPPRPKLEREFELQRERWMVTVIPEDQLGRPEERLRKKMEKLGPLPPLTSRRVEERAATLEQRLREAEGRARAAQETATTLVEETQERVQEAESRATSLQQRLHQTEQRATQQVTRLQQEAREAASLRQRRHKTEQQARLREAEKRAHAAEQGAHFLQQQVADTELRAREATQRAATAEKRLREAEERAHTAERMAASYQDDLQFWVVRREEIELTDRELGKGGWAVVRVARFRGTQVAAKCLIISDYDRQLFVREMNMAARVRHPNLIQFIGATLQGEPIILTELMATSLRAILERRPLNPLQITPISLDVARALNYLHLMHPDPILHRDVSSANVLMNPGPNNTWQAKVSDYGSANFVQRVLTTGPGNPAYAAPEAANPRQSPKMDVYSYGVVLLEMCTLRFPDSDNRDTLLQSVTQPAMVELIRRCLEQDPERRPTMSEIVEQLERP